MFLSSIVFWIGDLNYRLSDIDNDTCKKHISANKLHELMAYDQVCIMTLVEERNNTRYEPISNYV